jgi:hypothetical protein
MADAPQPKENESEKDYMDRCIPYFVHDGMFPRQAAMVCGGLYNKKSKGRKFDAMSSLDNIDFDD